MAVSSELRARAADESPVQMCVCVRFSHQPEKDRAAHARGFALTALTLLGCFVLASASLWSGVVRTFAPTHAHRSCATIDYHLDSPHTT